MDNVGTWQALGARSYLLRSSEARALVNIGLVVGSERALVIDTGCGPRHAAEILAAVRTLTALPLVVVNTHAHWDHFFGNAVFKHDGVTEFWAHATTARAISETGQAQRAEVAGPEPAMAAGGFPLTEIVVPNRLVGGHAVTLDLGGVTVELFILGPAHTPGDLMAGVPGIFGPSGAPGVLFAGDVLEEGAPPSVEAESDVPGWIAVLHRLAGMGEKYPVMVPGHGNPVTPGFAAELAAHLESGSWT